MTKVRFSASGYGSKTQKYRTRELAVAAVESEAAGMAGDYDVGESGVSRFGDEWVLQSRSGEEIARWEIL